MRSPGESDGALLAKALVAALREQSFLPTVYPSLFTGGIDEGSLHAYMLSALVLVGDRLGFTPVSDAPISDRLDALLIQEGAKRPDAIWLQRGQQEVWCLIEFDRFVASSLAPKAQNLLMMGKALNPQPHLVVLNFWSAVSVPSSALQAAQRVFARGFTHQVGVVFPPLGCPALLLETLVTGETERTRIEAIMPRSFIYGGEDKPHIVQQLQIH